MKALFRALLAAVGVFALLVVGGVVYVTTFLDPNDLKPRLVEAVHERTGLDLALNGPLSWTFYPRLGVTIQDAAARLPGQQEGEAPFAAFKRADVKVKFAPLLTGNVSVDGVTLDGLRLELVRDAQGRGNWQTLLEHMAESDETAPATATPAREEPRGLSNAANRPLSVDIANLQVSDGQVHYVDRQEGRDLRISDLALASTNVAPGQSFPLQLSFDLASNTPALTSHVVLDSDVQLSFRNARYQLTDLALKTTSQLPALAAQTPQALNLKAEELIADLDDEQYRIAQAQLDGNIHTASFGDQGLPFSLALNGEADLKAQTGQLNDIVLTSGDTLHLTGHLSATQLLDQPAYQGQLQLAPMNLKTWLNDIGIVPPQTADPEALTQVGLSSPVKGDSRQVTLPELALQLDGQTISGQLNAALGGKRVAFDLQTDRLDLDAYLPPRQEAAPKDTALLNLAVAPAFAATEGAQLLPVDLLRELALKGAIRVGELKMKNMALTNVVLRVQGEQGQHRLEQLSANLYGGTLKANGTLDVRKEPIQMRLDEALDSVQLAPLLADAADRNNLVRGNLALKGSFSSQTNALDSLTHNLNGNASLAMTDGAILGTNVSRTLCTAVAALQGNESTREWSPDTPFDRFSATANVVDGVVNNDDLVITIPGIELTGKGQANLATQHFAYALGARFTDTADQQACKVSAQLQKVRLPVRCEGEFSGEPGQWCHFDRDGFQQVLTGLAVDEGKQKLQQRLDKQLGDDLGKKIDQTLGEGSGKQLRDAIQGLFK